MKDSVIRRLEAIERSVADETGPERIPIIMQQGLGGPFMCEGVTFPTEEDALAAYADCENVVLVSVVDGRKKPETVQTQE
jgi:hypothetical protein